MMEKALDAITCCCTFGGIDQANDKRAQTRPRGRSRTPRLNINARFRCNSTNRFEKKRVVGIWNPFDFVLSGDQTRTKKSAIRSDTRNEGKISKETITNSIDQEQKSRQYQPFIIRLLRKRQNRVLNQVRSKLEMIEKTGKENSKALMNHQEKISRLKMTRGGMQGRRNSIVDLNVLVEKKYQDNSRNLVLPWKAILRAQCKQNRNASKTMKGTFSQREQKKIHTVEEKPKLSHIEQGIQPFSGIAVSKNNVRIQNVRGIKILENGRTSSVSTRTTYCSLDAREETATKFWESSRQVLVEKRER